VSESQEGRADSSRSIKAKVGRSDSTRGEAHYVKKIRSDLLKYKRKVRQLQARLDDISIVDILPDIDKPCVAHCGLFMVITSIPFTTPCCDSVLFTTLDDSMNEEGIPEVTK